MKKSIIYNNTHFVYHDYAAPTTSAETWVLLHGFGFTPQLWQHWLPTLTRQYRILLPAMCGFGGSDAIADLRLEDIADRLAAMLEQEGIKKCTFVGHSMGGYVGAHFAAHYPQYLSRLVFFHSSATADDTEKRQVRQKAIDFMQQNGTASFFDELMKNVCSPDYCSKNKAQIETLSAIAKNFPTENVIAAYRAMMLRHDQSAALQGLEIPVVFVSGGLDKSVSWQRNTAEAALLNWCKLIYLPEVAHMAMLEMPDIALNALLQMAAETKYLLTEKSDTVTESS